MSNLSIGLTGLKVAQQAIEIVGTNIANVSTEGYHRQDPILAPLSAGNSGNVSLAGVKIAEVRRSMDTLLENEILRRQPQMGQLSQELLTLQTVEATFGDLDSQGLAGALDDFFNALNSLAVQPQDLPAREQAVWAANGLAEQFHSLGTFLQNLQENIRIEALNMADRVNGLAGEIADSNAEIQKVVGRGDGGNTLQDRRDQAIEELGELVGVQVDAGSAGSAVKNVVVWGMPLVTGNSATELEVGLTDANELGVSVKGANYFIADVTGGRLAGLLVLKNEIVAGLQKQLDTLANQVISKINQYHVQGAGLAGSFSELAGWQVSEKTLDQWDVSVSGGSFYVRVIDQATGQVTRQAVPVDPAADTIGDIAARLDGLDHLTASAANSTLRIQAQGGYAFDFLPALTEQPYTSTLTGTSTPSISGIYSGAENQVYTCTVAGSGQVGAAADLAVVVRNEAGQIVKTINVGAGYAPSDTVEIDQGIHLAIGSGTLNDGEQFTVQALADSDPTGLLASAGINTFFSGTSAASMAVRDDVLSNAGRLATAIGAEMTDNTNVLRMARLGEENLPELGNDTPRNFFSRIVTGIGQRINVAQAGQASMDKVMRQLNNQRDAISGVDINEEAVRLLVFERMFQAMSKYINTQNEILGFLMELV